MSYQEQKCKLFLAAKRLEKSHQQLVEAQEKLKKTVPIAPAAPESEPDCQALLDAANAVDAMLDQMRAARDALDESIIDMTEVSNLAWNEWFVNCGV